MITLKRIEIRGFRGLREFLFPGAHTSSKPNLLLLGFNGTGKSSLNTALFFAFSGKLLPLSPAIEETYPVLYRHKALPAQTPAEVKIVFDNDGTEHWLKREIDGNGNITTMSSDDRAHILAEEGLNSYCFLTRPQFASMIDTVERESWKRLTPFLGHEEIGLMRDGLRGLSLSLKRDLNVNNLEREHQSLQNHATNLKATYQSLFETLGLNEMSLSAVTEQLSSIISSVPEISSFDNIPWTDLQLLLPGSEQAKRLTAELQSLNTEAAVAHPTLMNTDSLQKAVRLLREINDRSSLAHDLVHFEFLQSSARTIAGLTTERCPLCNISFPNWNEVRKSTSERLAELQETSKNFNTAIQTLNNILQQAYSVIKACDQTVPPSLPEFTPFQEAARKIYGLVEGILTRQKNSPPNGLRAEEEEILVVSCREFNNCAKEFSVALNKKILYTQDELTKIGESSATKKFFAIKETVSAYLTWKNARDKHTQLSRQLRVTNELISSFQQFYVEFDKAESSLSANILTELETDVQSIFSKLTNQKELKPVINSSTVQGVRRAEIMIEDFYGLGSVTARDYLSEANRSSLGLSIYFAGILKKSPTLRLMVLDDVTQSADGERRRLLANFINDVLANQFQLIVLTHDDNWYNRLATGPSKESWELRKVTGWTPDGLMWSEEKVESLLERASRKIANMDKSGGNELRQALEIFIDRLCESLKIQFPYQRSDYKFEVKRQQLLRQISGAWNLGNGFIDPNSTPLLLLQNTQRLANFASHAGSFELLSIQDLSEAVQDVSDLISMFSCKNNGGRCNQLLNTLTKSGQSSQMPECKKCKQPIQL